MLADGTGFCSGFATGFSFLGGSFIVAFSLMGSLGGAGFICFGSGFGGLFSCVIDGFSTCGATFTTSAFGAGVGAGSGADAAFSLFRSSMFVLTGTMTTSFLIGFSAVFGFNASGFSFGAVANDPFARGPGLKGAAKVVSPAGDEGDVGIFCKPNPA